MSSSTRRSATVLATINALKKAGAVLIVSALAVCGFLGGHYLFPSGSEGEGGSETDSNLPVSRTVSLPDSKLAAANIHVSPVRETMFQVNRQVPGTIRHDPTRFVTLRAPVKCLVQSVETGLGRTVARGEPLITLTGPEIGLVRARVQDSLSRLNLASTELDWVTSTHTNVTELVQFLETSPEVSAVEDRFRGRPLGTHGEELLSGYAELLATSRIADRSASLQSQGLVTGATVDERLQKKQAATAKFKSSMEESLFAAGQGLKESAAKLDSARRAHEAVMEELQVLSGGIDPAAAEAENAGPGLFTVLSPLTGTVVEFYANQGSRFETAETILAVADTSRVWVEAPISQRDWLALGLVDGLTLQVSSPALGEGPYDARVIFTGSSVSQTTLSVPLIAEISNEKNLFRAGMFVSVRVPVSEAHQALVVSEASLQRDETDVFVFVQKSENTFERIDVEIGESSEGWVEIRSGVSAGEMVVDAGAFLLKSELLLEAGE